MLDALEEKVNPEHTAVIVVDVQNDFCSSDGAFARVGKDISFIQQMVPRLVSFVKEARRFRVPVIFTRSLINQWTDSPMRAQRLKDTGMSRVPFCSEGAPGAEFYEVFPEPGECVVTKHRFSAFLDTNLDLILRSRKIRSLIMTGVATNVCVESTARDGCAYDYHIILLDDCCGTGSVAEHQSTLVNMRNYFGVVATSHDVVSAWTRIAGRARQKSDVTN